MLRISKTIIGGRRSRRYLTAALLWCLTMYGIAPIAISAQIAVSGYIGDKKIEIDPVANYTSPDQGALNAAMSGTPVDWQKDNTVNTDTLDTGQAGLLGGVVAV